MVNIKSMIHKRYNLFLKVPFDCIRDDQFCNEWTKIPLVKSLPKWVKWVCYLRIALVLSLELPWWFISHNIIIEIPEDVGWRFWCMGDYACEIDSGSSVDMEIRISLNSHMWYWNRIRNDWIPRLLQIEIGTMQWPDLEIGIHLTLLY